MRCSAQPSVRGGPIPLGSGSLASTSKGQLTLRKEVAPGGRLELHAERATAELSGFIGLLTGRTGKTASLKELNQAAAAGSSAQ